jgi:hypothetical protein
LDIRGASGGGLLFKIFNSYTWAFFLAGIFCLLGSLFVILIKKQKLATVVKDETMRL